MVRVDEMSLRFNFVADLGPAYAPNRYKYQVVLPYVNGITTGAGGAAGLGSDENPAFDAAHFAISYIWHKKAMELLVPDARPLNPEMPFGHRDFGGKWRFAMHDLGADQSGNTISNKWENKGQFISWFKYYVRPLHTEFAEVFFHKREQFCIPTLTTCSADPGYPPQVYNSALPVCVDTGTPYLTGALPAGWPAPFAPGVPTGTGTPPPTGTGDGPLGPQQPQTAPPETATNPPDQ
jgi:hypothetical protein